MREVPKVTLQEFKTSIEQRSVGNQLVIFLYEDVPFVADQYIREISSIKNKPIQYLENIDNIGSGFADIFGLADIDDGIRVYKTSEIETLSEKLKYEENLYIIVNKIKDRGIQMSKIARQITKKAAAITLTM